jgi:DNA repair exonuclease SbcCD nuclease subunit
MKVLIFSDLHLHNWNYGSTIVDGMNSRLRDQARVLDQIAMYCEHNEVDHIVFGGDLFHTHGKIDAGVLKVAYEGIDRILEKSNVGMDILVGNHDTADKSMAVHSLHWLKSFAQVKVVDTMTHDDLFSYLPYTEDKAVIEKFFQDANPICFLHQGIAGVPMGSGFLINEAFSLDMVPDYVDQVFTGHYHKHGNPSDKVTVPGSTLQLTWADEGDKRGFLIYDTNTGAIEHIESVAPKFVTVDFNNVTPFEISGNFIRVKGCDSTGKDNYREMLIEGGARSVEFMVEKTDAQTLKPIVTCDGYHLPDLVKAYEKQKEVTPERSKIGKELMK